MSVDNVQDNEDVIDLRKFFKVIMEKRKIFVAIIILCTFIATIVAFVMPKTYQSNTTIRIKTLTAAKGIELMKSAEVIEPVMDELNLSGISTAKFISSNLSIVNPRNTDLISVTAYGKTPEEAQAIVKAVLDNYAVAIDEYNEDQNASTLDYLNEYMAEAEKEMKEAENKLIAYQEQKGIPLAYAVSSDIDNMPMDADFIRLSRDRRIATERYLQLMRNYENAKVGEIQKAVEISTVGEANTLDETPVKPNKKIIIAIGFVLGVMISLGYSLFAYCRKYGINILN
ncbi:GNVR domain-containing protein [Megamonas hypermegale]|uniref:GNVR domain-containing protein n=1 Tax=Megamonas hypermegale TaxID=158847 RepID=UPI0025A33DE8|nr:GNVR domain-containing protein [Megamonas hypermegale]MDM8144157.1 GNVR domain-containing protein [Megamonas hypermegale]